MHVIPVQAIEADTRTHSALSAFALRHAGRAVERRNQVKLAALASLCCALVLQAGCVLLPIPMQERKVLAGTPVSEEQLLFLSPGVTTKSEVIDRLGDPDVIWEEARVFAYDWVMRQGILIWAIGGGYSGVAGATDLPKRYVLLIRFDDEDRVQRFERAVRPSNKGYGDFLEEWVRGSGAKASEESNRGRH
jgi:outer membrane protein assembly factor BamE (lipoprotein component of BamABCDE complex)